jgi:hypothetical protein
MLEVVAETSEEWLWEKTETDVVEDILTKFSHELLNDPDEPIIEFHFGCAAERIEWDDQDFSHMEIAPKVITCLNFEELGDGQFNALTPGGISSLFFRGRYRRRFVEAFRTALILERQRASAGLDSELNVPEIRKKMENARKAAVASLRYAMREGKST